MNGSTRKTTERGGERDGRSGIMKRLIETLVELYSRIPGPALANLRGRLGALPMQREGTLCASGGSRPIQ